MAGFHLGSGWFSPGSAVPALGAPGRDVPVGIPDSGTLGWCGWGAPQGVQCTAGGAVPPSVAQKLDSGTAEGPRGAGGCRPRWRVAPGGGPPAPLPSEADLRSAPSARGGRLAELRDRPSVGGPGGRRPGGTHASPCGAPRLPGPGGGRRGVPSALAARRSLREALGGPGSPWPGAAAGTVRTLRLRPCSPCSPRTGGRASNPPAGEPRSARAGGAGGGRGRDRGLSVPSLTVLRGGGRARGGGVGAGLGGGQAEQPVPRGGGGACGGGGGGCLGGAHPWGGAAAPCVRGAEAGARTQVRLTRVPSHGRAPRQVSGGRGLTRAGAGGAAALVEEDVGAAGAHLGLPHPLHTAVVVAVPAPVQGVAAERWG